MLRQKDNDDAPLTATTAGTSSTEYYKKMSERQLKESSKLAEQLICLRSDMEKQHVEIIRHRRQNSSSSSSCYTEILGLLGEEKTPTEKELLSKNLLNSAHIARSSLSRCKESRDESPFHTVRVEKGTPRSANRDLELSHKNTKPKEPPNRPYNFPTHTHTFK